MTKGKNSIKFSKKVAKNIRHLRGNTGGIKGLGWVFLTFEWFINHTETKFL